VSVIEQVSLWLEVLQRLKMLAALLSTSRQRVKSGEFAEQEQYNLVQRRENPA